MTGATNMAVEPIPDLRRRVTQNDDICISNVYTRASAQARALDAQNPNCVILRHKGADAADASPANRGRQ